MPRGATLRALGVSSTSRDLGERGGALAVRVELPGDVGDGGDPAVVRVFTNSHWSASGQGRRIHSPSGEKTGEPNRDRGPAARSSTGASPAAGRGTAELCPSRPRVDRCDFAAVGGDGRALDVRGDRPLEEVAPRPERSRRLAATTRRRSPEADHSSELIGAAFSVLRSTRPESVRRSRRCCLVDVGQLVDRLAGSFSGRHAGRQRRADASRSRPVAGDDPDFLARQIGHPESLVRRPLDRGHGGIGLDRPAEVAGGVDRAELWPSVTPTNRPFGDHVARRILPGGLRAVLGITHAPLGASTRTRRASAGR